MASDSSNPFNPRMVVGLIAAGIIGFLVLMLLLAFGDRIGSGRTGRANALSVSAVGYKGLVDLVGRVHHSYLIRNSDEFDASNLVVVALEPNSRPENLRRLLEARANRPTLIILPKWFVERDPSHLGWVRGRDAGLGGMVVRTLDWPASITTADRSAGGARLAGAGPLAGLAFTLPRDAQSILGQDLVPLVPTGAAPPRPMAGQGNQAQPGGGVSAPPAPAAQEGAQRPPPEAQSPVVRERAARPVPVRPRTEPKPEDAEPDDPDKPTFDSIAPPILTPNPDVGNNAAHSGPVSAPALVAQLGNRPHYVVADPDLLNNQALRDPARARAAVELLDRLNATGDTAVGFDLTMNGYGSCESGSVLRMAFEPPFLAMTLALFVAALLAGLHGAFRFGPARREQRAIAFGKAALVENSAGLIRLAEREAHLGGAYADVMRGELARAAAAPGHLQGEALDRYLNRLAREGPTFSELAADLATARSRSTLMAAARRLWDWRKTVLR
jgi:hypothetical protein